MTLFPSIGRKDAATARAVSRGRGGYGRAVGMRAGDGDVAAQVADRYERSVWAFRAIDAIATNQVALRIVVREGSDPFSGEEVKGHPVAELLNGQANPYETATVWRYRLSTLFSVSSQGAYVERVDSNLGAPIELHHLPPHKTRAVPPDDPRAADGIRAFVDHYAVRVGDAGSTLERLEPEQVLWIRKPHPLDPYRAVSPMDQAGIAIDTAMLERVFTRNYLRRDGRGAAVITSSSRMTDDDVEILDQRMNGGADRAGAVTILDDMADLFVHEFGGDPGDWPRQAGDSARDEVLVAFGTPLSIIGKASDSTFANSDAEARSFWRETMLGHLRFLSTSMDPLLEGERAARVIGWDLSDVEVLEDVKRERNDFHLREFESGARTLDEYLADTGREPVGGDVGATRFMPLGRVPLEVRPPSRQREAVTASAAGALDVKAADEDPDPAPDPYDEVRSASRETITRWERAVYDVAARWFDRVAAIADAKLRGKQGRQGTRHWDPPVAGKAVDPEDVFPVERFGQEFVDDVRAELERLYDEVGGDVAGGLDVSFNLQDPRVTESLTTRANRLRDVADSTFDDVAEALAAGEAAGESIDDLADRVQQVLARASRVRARTIARTEVVSAANDASWQAAGQAGGVVTKTWLTSKDSRVRGIDPDDQFSHVAMDGVTVPLASTFSVQGDDLRYPGDPSGQAGNVINCRCVLLYNRGV